MKRTSKGSGRKKTSVVEKLAKIAFDLEKVEAIAATFGSTDEQLAAILDVDERTITRWKKDQSFLSALKKGKNTADAQVVKSLYQRATGYDHEDIYFSSYEGEVTQTPYTKHFIPDVTAQIFWLKNRQPTDWRDVHDITSGGESLFEVLIGKKANKNKDS